MEESVNEPNTVDPNRQMRWWLDTCESVLEAHEKRGDVQPVRGGERCHRCEKTGQPMKNRDIPDYAAMTLAEAHAAWIAMRDEKDLGGARERALLAAHPTANYFPAPNGVLPATETDQ